MHHYQQKLRKTLMYNEGRCGEPEGTALLQAQIMCCCLGGGGSSKIVVPTG